MSDVFHPIQESAAPTVPSSAKGSESKENSGASFIERFFDSFFQEKNIRWLLLVGAAIIFGSSLMLVTRAWPDWSGTMRAFTVLAYTVSLFGVGHFCRVRLQLKLTYRVLYGLTVLLIPISFLSLSWLSSGTAVQPGLLSSSLLIPFLASSVFLWFAARTIFDHVLHGRQTTFVVSYCLLTMAGTLPEFATGPSAFVFMLIAWVVMTAGVVKVNRRVFELTLKHQLPRVFGFLPILLLGIQYLVLVGVLAVPALPLHWMGLGCVLLATTVLFTARSLMNVFEQQTGNLVRPYPWSISAPLIATLCLTVVGVSLSFSGFSYVGASTFAVVPTSFLAAGLMLFISVQTGHPAFGWFGLLFLTIGYQSCPVLFSDLVQALKQSTADAIRRERIPVSMYGLTYVPLLMGLVVAFKHLTKRKLTDLAMVVRQYLTVLMLGLFALSFLDIVSAFMVNAANVITFAVFGIVLKDRRFGHLSVLSGVVTIACAIPALNNMAYIDVSIVWAAPLLSIVAMILASSSFLDRLFGIVRLPVWLTEILNVGQPGQLEEDDCSGLLSNADQLPLLQTVGCCLSILLGIQWMVSVSMTMFDPLAMPLLVQFGCIFCSLVIYTWRHPHYLTGLSCQILCLFAVARLVAGYSLSLADILNLVTAGTLLICVGTSLLLGLTFGGQAIRRLIQFERNLSSVENQRGWRTRVQAFVVPGFDLSFWALCSLAAVVHLPALFALNSSWHQQFVSPELLSLWTTPLALLAFVGMSFAAKTRSLGILATLCLPLMVTAYLPMLGMPLTFSSRLLMWMGTAIAAYLSAVFLETRYQRSTEVIRATSETAILGLTIVGLLAISPVVHLLAIAGCGVLIWLSTSADHLKKRTLLGMLANVHFLIASGMAVDQVAGSSGFFIFAPVCFAICGAAMLVLRSLAIHLEPSLTRAWVGCQLSCMIVLYALCISAQTVSVTAPCIFLGLVFAGIYEFREALQKQDRLHVQAVWGIIAAGVAFLCVQTLDLMTGIMVPYLMLSLSLVMLSSERFIKAGHPAEIFRKDLMLMAQMFPALIAMGLLGGRTFGALTSSTAHHSFILMICSGIYGYLYFRQPKLRFVLPGLILFNYSLSMMWERLSWTGAELYMIPAGFSVLLFSRVLKTDLPAGGRTVLQYAGSLLVLLSPILQVLDGSWQHMLTLLILSVIIVVVAIGLRVRSLVYCGTGFLLVDLLAMVVQSTSDSPTLLWGIGILTGVGLMALAAYCERHREQLLARIRMLSSELATWD